jgi:CDP-glucose 4,6-dehydratase
MFPIATLDHQRVLITGANGFIGQHLMKSLRSRGITVFGQYLDILDYSSILRFMQDHTITTCVHLAGFTTVENGYANPAQTLETNIQGTINVLEGARVANLERIVISSSVHVYGLQPPPFYETSPLLPTRPYETSKACADMIAQSYATTFNLPVLIPRFVNTYGPGDTHLERLIPKTITRLLQGKSPTMWKELIQRDYLFIDDVVEAYIKLIQMDPATLGENRAINIGTGYLTSVQDIMTTIAHVMNIPLHVSTTTTKRQKTEVLTQQVSTDKALQLLDWQATVNLEEGLHRTVLWYMHHYRVREKASSKT